MKASELKTELQFYVNEYGIESVLDILQEYFVSGTEHDVELTKQEIEQGRTFYYNTDPTEWDWTEQNGAPYGRIWARIISYKEFILLVLKAY